MDYIENRKSAYADPNSVLPNVKSIVMLGTNYRCEPLEFDRSNLSPVGRVSCYAWGGEDYHDLIHRNLKQLKSRVESLLPNANTRGVIDTAPILEREFAQKSGIGWQAKNTMLISKTMGSFFFLSCFLLDVELQYDEAFDSDHCGTCTACIDACPTDAFVAPKILDARKCISYLTIELRAPMPRDLRPQVGDWLFGCDVCQEVCPWNRHAPIVNRAPFSPQPDLANIDLHELFELDDEAFRKRFRKTPLWRSKRKGILRNAAVVLGNRKNPESIPVLLKALCDKEPLIRGASAWALGEFEKQTNILDELQSQLANETDEQVQTEIKLALANHGT